MLDHTINPVVTHNAVAGLVGLYTEMVRAYDAQVKALIEENNRLRHQIKQLTQDNGGKAGQK